MKSLNMKHADIQLLLGDYRDLRGPERAAVEAHVSTCSVCAARLAAYHTMDRDLLSLRDSRPDARLRTKFYEQVKTGAGEAGETRPRPAGLVAYGLGSFLAVLVLAVGVWAVLRPGEPGSEGRGGQGSFPPAASAEMGEFVWQVDGVYGYEMLRPAGWAMTDLGMLREYAGSASGASSASLALQVVNLKARSYEWDGDGGLGDLAARYDAASNLEEWAKSVEEVRNNYGPPFVRVGEAPEALIYQQEYDSSSRVRAAFVALIVREGQPLIVGLDADNDYGSLESLESKGIWDDFMTMIESIRPIPPDPNNVAPWAPTAMPTADTAAVAVTPAPTAPARDPRTTQVMLDIYSGLPNPSWSLSAGQTASLKTLLDGQPEAACGPLDLTLGLRGFVVELGQAPELSNEYRLRVHGGQVRWGDPWTPEAPALCLNDKDHKVERFLLETGRASLAPELFAMLVAQAASTVTPHPMMMTPTPAPAGAEQAVSREGTMLALPEDWEECGVTERSWLFCKRGTDSGDNPLAPPVFYVTEIPHGFANEDASAYNWWSAEEFVTAFNTAVGDTFAVSHAPPGYNSFTRLPDTVAGGRPAVVVENTNVWEAPAGTKDRRVLVRAENAVFVLGTYYVSTEDLRAFESAVASFLFPAPMPQPLGEAPPVTPTPPAQR